LVAVLPIEEEKLTAMEPIDGQDAEDEEVDRNYEDFHTAGGTTANVTKL
jgi:hypothetical protein